MKTVRLNSTIDKNGSAVFNVMEPKEAPSMYFSQPHVETELKELYKERNKLNVWRTIDRSVMEKVFGI